MDLGWDFPSIGFVKANVHAVYYEAPLPNGNTTGVGIVIRDEDGVILAMITGTLGHLYRRSNELWAMMLGLQLAFKIGRNRLELETESREALRDWDDWRWYVDQRHAGVIQQLNQRLKDRSLVLRKKQIRASQNQLARYLAEDGAASKSSAVCMYRPFGRVSELWHLDMGLGFIGGNFQVLDEDEYLLMHEEEVEMEEGHGEANAEEGEASAAAEPEEGIPEDGVDLFDID